MSTESDRSAFWRRNALSLVLLALFASSLVGHVIAGRTVYNHDLEDQDLENHDLEAHGLSALGWTGYLGSGQFVSSMFENWEGEFLQMGLYVLLTVVPRQRGSAESKSFDDGGGEIEPGPTPWPVSQTGA